MSAFLHINSAFGWTAVVAGGWAKPSLLARSRHGGRCHRTVYLRLHARPSSKYPGPKSGGIPRSAGRFCDDWLLDQGLQREAIRRSRTRLAIGIGHPRLPPGHHRSHDRRGDDCDRVARRVRAGANSTGRRSTKRHRRMPGYKRRFCRALPVALCSRDCAGMTAAGTVR